MWILALPFRQEEAKCILQAEKWGDTFELMELSSFFFFCSKNTFLFYGVTIHRVHLSNIHGKYLAENIIVCIFIYRINRELGVYMFFKLYLVFTWVVHGRKRVRIFGVAKVFCLLQTFVYSFMDGGGGGGGNGDVYISLQYLLNLNWHYLQYEISIKFQERNAKLFMCLSFFFFFAFAFSFCYI